MAPSVQESKSANEHLGTLSQLRSKHTMDKSIRKETNKRTGTTKSVIICKYSSKPVTTSQHGVMESRFNIGDHVAIVGSFGDSLEGAKEKVVGLNRLEYDGHQVLDDVTVLFDNELFRGGAFQISFASVCDLLI